MNLRKTGLIALAFSALTTAVPAPAIGGGWVKIAHFDENYAAINYGTWGTTEADCRARQAVCHSNGKQTTEVASTNPLDPNIRAWESDPAGNSGSPPWSGGTFTWFGPYHTLPKGYYSACFTIKDYVEGAQTSVIYLEVIAGTETLAFAYGNLSSSFNNAYADVCLPFGSTSQVGSGIWSNVEYRIKVSTTTATPPVTGRIRVDKVDLYHFIPEV